ncbi:hypothetical protein ASE49_17460 [Novosphingobium sp. Leaf2]|nr:hypothetical protein ASE49_17460 [Novosphingobium sp. Leaf2]
MEILIKEEAMRANIRDARGNLIGYTEELQGNVKLRDHRGNLLGSYNTAENKTRDAKGNLVGTGKQLMRLL